MYTCYMYILLFLFCFFVAQLLVSINLLLPMFHLTSFSTVKDTVTSFAWSEFVLWWIMWSVAGCTFEGFWCERGCCSSFFFVNETAPRSLALPISSTTLVLFHMIAQHLDHLHREHLDCTALRSFPACCLVISCCYLVTLIHTSTVFVHVIPRLY